jgi:hypothetical protein
MSTSGCGGDPAGRCRFNETSDNKPRRLVETETIGDGLLFVTCELVRSA